MTPLPGHFLSLEVMWRHFLPRGCLLRRAITLYEVNVPYTRVFGLLHPLPGDFWSNDVTSASLPVTWGHVTSLPPTWLPPPAGDCLVRNEMYNICEFLAFYSLFQVTSVKWLHFRSLPVTWGHVMSFPVTWLPSPASYSLVKVKCTVYTSFWPSTATSWIIPGKCHFCVTLGHLRSRDVILSNVTASCELQLYRKWNVQYTQVFGLLQPPPGDFRSNDVTSGSLPVT